MRSLTVVAMIALLVFPAASAETVVQGGRYVAGADALILWCSADPHPILPTGDPSEYSPLGYLLSGEPECAGADAANAVAEATGHEREQWGYGGFAWALPPAVLGSQVFVWAEDDFFGDEGFLRVAAYSDSGADAVEEGCGPQVIVPPADTERHWQSSPENVLHLLWAWIPAGFVDENMELCFASTGHVWATWEV